MIKKNLIKFSDKLFPILDVIKYPIKKEPIIFTEIVPQILDANNDLLIFVKIYLIIAPNAPPVATKIKLNNILKLEVGPLLLQQIFFL